jgi:hypothetical protein
MRDLTIVYDQRCGLCSRLGDCEKSETHPLAYARGYFAEEMLLIGRVHGSPAREQGDHSTEFFTAAARLASGAAGNLQRVQHWAKRLSGRALLALERQALTILSANRLQISTCHGTGA